MATTLGATEIAASRIGLGCTTFGREIDESASFAIMDHALEHGVNLFDTAESYGGGNARQARVRTMGVDDVREVSHEMHSSEKIIGRWLSSRRVRDRIVLQTKVTANFTRSHIAEALDASLLRLNTDCIDVYMLHSFDAGTPIEETLDALDRAKRAGKIRAAGCSNFTAGQLADSLAVSTAAGLIRFEVVQPIYNLAVPEIERDLLPLCREQKIGVTSYSPLGAGFLTGKYSGDRSQIPKGTRFDVAPGHADVYFHDRCFAAIERLRRAAAAAGVSTTYLAYAWVLRNPDITTMLVGARNIAQLNNALEALTARLSTEVCEFLNGAVAEPVAGASG